jgi:hypothetical protein
MRTAFASREPIAAAKFGLRLRLRRDCRLHVGLRARVRVARSRQLVARHGARADERLPAFEIDASAFEVRVRCRELRRCPAFFGDARLELRAEAPVVRNVATHAPLGATELRFGLLKGQRCIGIVERRDDLAALHVLRVGHAHVAHDAADRRRHLRGLRRGVRVVRRHEFRRVEMLVQIEPGAEGQHPCAEGQQQSLAPDLRAFVERRGRGVQHFGLHLGHDDLPRVISRCGARRRARGTPAARRRS